MRHVLVVLPIVLVATRARADSESCSIDVVSAPASVREAITERMGREPPCAAPLELRVIATANGDYYAIALGASRVLEDTVDSPEAVAALVAGWQLALEATRSPKADRDAPLRVEFGPIERARTGTSRDGTLDVDFDHDPVRITDDPDLDAPIEPQRPRRRIAVGLIAAPGVGGGVGGRAAFDVWSHGRWAFGISVDVSEVEYLGPLWVLAWEKFQFVDATMAAYVAPTWRRGKWSVRGLGALGMMTTFASIDGYRATRFTYMAPAAQLAVFGGRDLGQGWGLEIGPVLTAFSQTPMSTDTFGPAYSRSNSLLVFAGVTHGL
jgi:hypothetical protein